MNNDLEQFTEERLNNIIELADNPTMASLARIALAAKQAKPFCYVSTECIKQKVDVGVGVGGGTWAMSQKPYNGGRGFDLVNPLYTTPQPAHTEQDGWIKCSERMPDSKNDVQLFCSDTREQFVGFHRGNGMFQFFNMNDVIGECEPTHWMPLPAGPKPESE